MLTINTKVQNKHLLTVIFSIFIFTSCSINGLNIDRKTPEKPFKYPVFTQADTLYGSLSKYRKAFDVTYYDINIDVDIKKRVIKGFVDIYFNAVNDIDTLQLDLYENLAISAITYNADTLKFQRKYKEVFIAFAQKIKKGEKAKISVFYYGKPIKAKRPPWEGGFVWKRDKDKNPWIGVACEKAGASLWWPLKDHLTDEPDSLKMSVTIPKGLFCVSNGRLTSRKTEGERETFTWKTSYPINTYNATLYIGNFKHFTIPYKSKFSSFDMDFYVLPYNLEKAKTHFAQAVDIIHFYENTFGEYPWARDGYKLVEGPFEGMEHQTAIAYGNGYKNVPYYNFDYIILHESAHEWWGNSVSAGDYSEIWLHEGFATYSEALYVEHIKGYAAYIYYLNYYSLLIKNIKPVIGPSDVSYWEYKDTDVYFKGALMLHTLRNTIDNDSVFFDIIKTFYKRNKYSITTTKNFIDLVNEKTKQDMGWFFNLYLYNRICPQLEYNYYTTTIPKYDKMEQNENVNVSDNEKNNNEEQHLFSFKWNNVKDDFKLPINIKTKDGVIKIHPTSQLQTIIIKSGGPLQFNTNLSYISWKNNKELKR